MPNFAAYAAHESANFALLNPSPEEISCLRRHLLALSADAPTALHPLLRSDLAALESASQAASTARTLTGVTRTLTVGRARDLLRTTVQQCMRTILAVEPTAARFRGTDMPVTPDAITAATRAYFKAEAQPQELHAIETGTPQVRVHCRSDHRLGREITAHITAGIAAPEWWLPAHPAIVLRFRRLDGRISPADNARRLLWRKDPTQHYLAVTGVPVEFRNDYRV